MKDAYSFHIDEASLEQGYRAMHDGLYPHLRAHAAPIPRGAVPTRAASVAASRRNSTCWPSPARTPSSSPTATTTRPTSRWRRRSPRRGRAPRRGGALAEVSTPGVRTIAELTASLGVSADRCVKTLLVDGARWRGDRAGRARRSRAERGQGAEASRRAGAASDGERRARARGHRLRAGILGPVGLRLKVYADRAAAAPRRLRLRRQSPRPASHGRQLGPRSRRSPRSPTCGTSCRAIRARPVAAGSRSRAASRSATSSSSVPSTARP